ncbi:hypothetical protein [Streptomyces sp. V2I9]|uniref:hypothetical protein n=1 Tax=Streptomyces sp. V2I9 TaxID=3042304 RepID=UPI0027867736|nr:hypothetical protein [Streptomyces sp. V2I9]MDQ0985495.1 hypothetical protein [Streptomyces sp. V2I9]
MHAIEFRRTSHPAVRPEGGAAPVVGILVDGVPLVELVRAVELPYAQAEQRRRADEGLPGTAPLLAGDYTTLGPAYDWPSRHFLGEPRNLPWGGEEGETMVLGCPCGIDECWALMARITVTPRTVTWSAFRNNCCDWDLSALGSFVFSRRQYEDSLRGGAPRP